MLKTLISDFFVAHLALIKNMRVRAYNTRSVPLLIILMINIKSKINCENSYDAANVFQSKKKKKELHA